MSISSWEILSNAGRARAIAAFCLFGLAGLFLAVRVAAEPLPGGNLEGSPANRGSGFAASIRGTASVADFDGDSRTDIAFAKPRGLVNGVYHYQIEVLLSAQQRTTFEVESGPAGGGLHITARDIDGDRDLDLVITTEFSRKPVGVWINDGHGGFTPGDAAIYPDSIWQETKEALEKPYSLQRVDISCVMPGGGCSAGPRGLPVPSFGNPGAPVLSTSDGHVSYPWNLGRPLRAPPGL
jgi:hypothetical protein